MRTFGATTTIGLLWSSSRKGRSIIAAAAATAALGVISAAALRTTTTTTRAMAASRTSRQPHWVQVGNDGDGGGGDDGKRSRRVRVVHISDTHRRHAEFLPAIPDGDILVHSGDFDSFSAAKMPFLRLLEEREIAKVAAFFAGLPHKHRVFVPGNHDMRLASYHSGSRLHKGDLAARLAGSCHVLIDSGVTLCGLKFYGVPWCPLRDASYARGFSKPWHELLPHWASVPEGTDVLVTHIPPWEELGDQVRSRIKPRALLHGHIHGGNGVKWLGNTLVSNAAMAGNPRPVVIDFYLPADGKA